VERMLNDSEFRLTQQGANVKKALHDSFCAVWNATVIDLERDRQDLSNMKSSVKYSVLSVKRKQVSDRINDLEFKQGSLQSLEHSFRVLGLFVKECVRFLHSGPPVRGTTTLSATSALAVTLTVKTLSVHGTYSGLCFCANGFVITTAHNASSAVVGISDADSYVNLYNGISFGRLLLFRNPSPEYAVRAYVPLERVCVAIRLFDSLDLPCVDIIGPTDTILSPDGLVWYDSINLIAGCSGAPVFSMQDGAMVGVHFGSDSLRGLFAPLTPGILSYMTQNGV